MKIIFVSFLKVFFRNRGALLGSILTPILFLILFGFVFGEEKSKNWDIGIYPKAPPSLIKTVKTLSLKYHIYQDILLLKKDLNKKKIDIGIEVGERGLTFYYNKGDLKNAPVIKGIINNIITKYEEETHGIVTLFTVKAKNVQIGKVTTTSLGYLIAGVISMSILSLGMFSIIEAFARYRKLGILKRLSVTPMNPFLFVVGIVLGRLIIGIFTAYFIYFISQILFSIDFSINPLLFTISILIAGISMSGFGALITLIFKEANMASNAGSILFTIMIFFSGVYFPTNFLPKGVRLFSYIFPLTYVAQNMRYALGIEYVNYKFFIYSNLFMLTGGIILLKWVSKTYFNRGR